MAEGQVNLTDEELKAAIEDGAFNDPRLLDKLDSDSRRRFVKVNAQVHPTESRIGAAPEDTSGVTLGDFRTDPMAAFRKSAGIIGSDLRNPKVMLPLLASGVVGAVAGAADRAPSMPSLRMEPGTLKDVASVILGEHRVNPAVRLGQRAMENMRGTPEPAPPPAPPEAPLALTRRVRDEYRAKQAAAAPASSPTPPAPAATPAPTPDVPVAAPSVPKVAKGRGAKAIGRQAETSGVNLTPAEEAQAVRWLSQGVDPDVVVQRIMQSRELTQRLNLHTPDEAAKIVDQRNVTGDWPPQFTKPKVKK